MVVMGVSGSGKTTVGERVAERLGWAYTEGDDLHPPANRATMAAGQALTDDDRWPWLRAVADWIGLQEASDAGGVVTCSALKRSYRDLLREGHPSVLFAHVTVDPQVLAARLRQRSGHFMPASLLASQLATVEPLQPDEPGLQVPGDGSVDDVVGALLVGLTARGAVEEQS